MMSDIEPGTFFHVHFFMSVSQLEKQQIDRVEGWILLYIDTNFSLFCPINLA